MTNINFSFDTKKLEQQIKKKQREMKRQAEKEARKEKRIAIAKSIFDKQPVVGGMKMLDKNSEEILKILLKISDEQKNLEIEALYDDLPEVYLHGLEQILDTLQQYGIVFDHHEFIGGSFRCTLSPIAKTYFEDKEKAIMEEKNKVMAQNINIQNLNASGSNLNFGTITHSTISAENIVNNIEKQIEELGGEDKDELKDILEEVKELCENITINNTLPKRKNLMTKISNHLEKHGWFYGSVVQLLGTAALNVMIG